MLMKCILKPIPVRREKFWSELCALHHVRGRQSPHRDPRQAVSYPGRISGAISGWGLFSHCTSDVTFTVTPGYAFI